MGNDHSHAVAAYNRAFAIGVLLNTFFVAVEAGYGFFIGSLALLADAGHNLSDVVGLLLAWGASFVATKPASDKRTYGFRKVTILASLASAVLLLVALGGIAWEAVGRFSDPAPVKGMLIVVVAGIGVVINTVSGVDISGIRATLLDLDLVVQVHDLHVWALSTTEAALTMHLVVANDKLDNRFLQSIHDHLHDEFGIEHATIQVEARQPITSCEDQTVTCN